MSAIKPSISTPNIGKVPVVNTTYVHPTARPSGGFGGSPVASWNLLNYIINGTYGFVTGNDARKLFADALAMNLIHKVPTNDFSRVFNENSDTGVFQYGVQGWINCEWHNFVNISFNFNGQQRGYGLYAGVPRNTTSFTQTVAWQPGVRFGDSFQGGGGSGSGLGIDNHEYFVFVAVCRWQGGFGEERFYHFALIDHRTDAPYDDQLGQICAGYVNVAYAESNFGSNHLLPDENEDPNDDAGTTDPKGKEQKVHDEVFEHTVDIEMPDITLYPSTAAAGLVTLYAPSLTLIQSFADELWQDNVLETIFQYFGKPMDAIVGMGVLPFSPPTSGYKKPKIGTYTCTTALPVVTHQFHEIDCGTLRIEPAWENYLDYSPYTRIMIYLPYVGTRELDVDEIMGHTLYVKYRIDCYNGNLVAFVGIDGVSGMAVRYQFSGNCMQQLPINAQSFDNMLQAGIQLCSALVGSIAVGGQAKHMAGAQIAGAMASDNPIGAATSAAQFKLGQARRDSSLASAAVDAVMNAKPKVEKSGAIGASVGQMSVQTPFITRIMPRQSLPEQYMRYKGYPLNATSPIGDNPGFTVVDDVRLNNLPATIPEIDEIYKLLGEGVIV